MGTVEKGWVRAAAVGAAAALALGLSGCNHRKITECNALISAINGGVQGLEKTPKADGDPSGGGDVKALAEAMDRIASDTGAVAATLPEVRKFAASYQKMAKDIARAERDLGAAVVARDAAKRTAAEQALDLAVKQEDPLVEEINRFCQAP